MTSRDLAVLILPMLLSLVISLAYGSRLAESEKEFPKVFARTIGIHGRVILLGGIGWILYAPEMSRKIAGGAYYAMAFFAIGIIDYIILNRRMVKN